jgi:hypothetical protein
MSSIAQKRVKPYSHAEKANNIKSVGSNLSLIRWVLLASGDPGSVSCIVYILLNKTKPSIITNEESNIAPHFLVHGIPSIAFNLMPGPAVPKITNNHRTQVNFSMAWIPSSSFPLSPNLS